MCEAENVARMASGAGHSNVEPRDLCQVFAQVPDDNCGSTSGRFIALISA